MYISVARKKKLETTQMPVDDRLDKLVVLYSRNGMLQSMCPQGEQYFTSMWGKNWFWGVKNIQIYLQYVKISRYRRMGG